MHYLEVVDAETLRPEGSASRPARGIAAAYLGEIRRIGNVAGAV